MGRMTTDGRAAEPPAKGRDESWREFAVSRSLEAARSRAEQRVQRFIDAAQELVSSGGGTDFTVQEVVERSGQSLRSFYQHFDGKHELLLALFEESVASTVDVVHRRIDDETDPLERLRLFVVEYHELCRPTKRRSGGGPSPVISAFAWQLLTEHPREAARAFAPLSAMFRQLVTEAMAAGAVRDSIDVERLTGVVLEVVMFNAFSSTISGVSSRNGGRSTADELWDLLFRGIAAH
jgi:AcrR family transcriptional regulator